MCVSAMVSGTRFRLDGLVSAGNVLKIRGRA